jgi:NAD(P)-dependent dehydrogenase (short-subunit alcohol dehydrogenase family)
LGIFFNEEERMAANDQIFDLSGRVAVVTGAGQGFGRTFSLGLARHGATAVALDIDLKKAEETVAEIKDAGYPDAIAVEADVASKEQIEETFNKVDKDLGSLDILVNNAGLWSLVPAMELSMEEWDRVLAVNLTGLFICCRAAAALMLPRERGSIINISSISGVLGFKQRVAYSTTKHGDLGITRSLANEFAPKNVRVNAIGPGAHETEMTKEWRADPEVMQRELLDKIPMNRLGDPEELVGPLVFLASEASSYVTGQCVFSDGGWLLQ